MGTRPEAIKMALVGAALRARAKCVEPIVCTTAQHRELIDQVQELFGLVPDLDLNLITPDQSLNGLSRPGDHGVSRFYRCDTSASFNDWVRSGAAVRSWISSVISRNRS